jgi:hypothetical protein
MMSAAPLGKVCRGEIFQGWQEVRDASAAQTPAQTPASDSRIFFSVSTLPQKQKLVF